MDLKAACLRAGAAAVLECEREHSGKEGQESLPPARNGGQDCSLCQQNGGFKASSVYQLCDHDLEHITELLRASCVPYMNLGTVTPIS